MAARERAAVGDVVVQFLVCEVDAAVLAVDLPLGADDVVCLVPVVVGLALDS
jgi:hypothetical protein